jgi:hypothetical protein
MTRVLPRLLAIGALAVMVVASSPATFARTTIEVSVTRPAGAPATPLRAENFDVLLDGVTIPVSDVIAAPQPATVVILVDATASMPLHMLDLAPSIASGVVHGLTRGDRVRLGVIGGAVRFGASFTDDARTAVAPLIPFFTRGDPEPSPIWDAIDAASALLDPEHGVRAIVVITDGKASGNRIGFDEMTARVLGTGVHVEVIAEAPEVVVAQQGSTTAAAVRPSASIHRLADLTGGAYLPDGPADISPQPLRLDLAGLDAYRERTRPRTDALIEQVFADLHGTYLLSIDVPADHAEHRLDVHAHESGTTVRAPNVVVGR